MKRLFRLGFISALAVPVMTLAFVSGPANAAPTTPPPTTCSAGVPAPTNIYPGTTVTANNFEAGTLAGFTVNTGTTGTATIDNTQAQSGKCSAHLHVTTDPGSLANLVTSLPTNSNNVYADAWFNITTAGVAGNDVPYFRFFFDTTRFVDIYRYNSNGQMWLRVTSSTGFNYTKLVSGSISLNAWRHVAMHVIANGAASTVEVWLDGTSIFSSNQIDTTATTVTAVQLGAEHLTQMGDEYIDDLVIKTGSGAAAAARLNDFNGDGKTDVVARDSGGELWLYPGTGAGGWNRRIDLGSGWNTMSAIVSAGDFNGDGKADVIARDKSGELWLYPGTGTGNWSTRKDLGSGWNVMTAIVAPGDFNGDGQPDLIARDSTGELWLYPNNGAGDWLKRVDLGSGWNVMSSLVSPGDFNADGKADVIARDTSGKLWLYPGNGKDGWSTRVSLGAGWNVMTAITAPGDMNSDARPDVIARDNTGELWLYPNNGAGDWSNRIDLGPGWNTMTSIL